MRRILLTLLTTVMLLSILITQTYAQANDPIEDLSILSRDVDYNFITREVTRTAYIDNTKLVTLFPTHSCTTINITGSYTDAPTLKGLYYREVGGTELIEIPTTDYTRTVSGSLESGYTVNITDINPKYDTMNVERFKMIVSTTIATGIDPTTVNLEGNVVLKTAEIPNGVIYNGTVRPVVFNPDFEEHHNNTIFTKFYAKDKNGNEIPNDAVFRQNDFLRIYYDWSLHLQAGDEYNIEDGLTAGDYFAFKLPTGLSLTDDIVKSPLVGSDSLIYGYLYAQASTNQAMIVFSRDVEMHNMIDGTVYFEIGITDIEEVIKEGIKLPLSDGTIYELPLKYESDNIDISKLGAFGTPGAGQVVWSIIVNETHEKLDKLVIFDEREGTSWYFPSSAPTDTKWVITAETIEGLTKTLILDKDYTVSGQPYNSTITFIDDYASTTDKIIAQRVAHDNTPNDANGVYKNKVTATADNNKKGVASATLSRNDQTITKKVVPNNDGSLSWTVQFNQSKNALPLNQTVLTDTLQPAKPAANVYFSDNDYKTLVFARHKFDENSLVITKNTNPAVDLIENTDYTVEYKKVNLPVTNANGTNLGVTRECWELVITFSHGDAGGSTINEHYTIKYNTIPDSVYNNDPIVEFNNNSAVHLNTAKTVNKNADPAVVNSMTNGIYTARQTSTIPRFVKTIVKYTSVSNPSDSTEKAEMFGEYKISVNSFRLPLSPPIEIIDRFSVNESTGTQGGQTFDSVVITATKPDGTIVVLQDTDYVIEIASEANPIAYKTTVNANATLTSGFKITITNAEYYSSHIVLNVKTKVDLSFLRGTTGDVYNSAILNLDGAYSAISTVNASTYNNIRNNGSKSGYMNPGDRSITWTVCFNTLFQDMENPVMTDYIPLDQKLIIKNGVPQVRVYGVSTKKSGGDAQVVFSFERDTNPSTSSPKEGDWSSYKVEYDEATGKLEVKFDGKATRPYMIVFDVERVLGHPEPYTNTAKVTDDNNSDTADLLGSISIMDSGNYLSKTGTMGTNRNVDWQLIANKSMLKIDDGFEITDTLDPNKCLAFVPNSLVITEGKYLTSYTKTANVWQLGVDYKVEYDDVYSGFKIILLKEFNYPLFVDYQTYAAVSNGVEVSNAVSAKGMQIVAPEEKATVRVAYSTGGGTGDSTKYFLNISKEDSDDSSVKLEGAGFRIWNNKDKTGFPLNTIWTDANGVASCELFLAGTYYIEEFKAPTGYKISTSSQNIEVKFTDTDNNQNITVTNQKKALTFKKVDGQNKNLLAGAEFKLYKYIGTNRGTEPLTDTAVWEIVDTKTSGGNGLISFINLTDGLYCLDETIAPKGYQKPNGDWLVTISDNDPIIQARGQPPAFITNGTELSLLNYKPMDMPTTGGTFMLWFSVLGTILMGFGVFIIIKRKNLCNLLSNQK